MPDSSTIDGEARRVLETYYGKLGDVTWHPMSYVVEDWFYPIGHIHIGDHDMFTTGYQRTQNYSQKGHFSVLARVIKDQ